MRTLLVTLLVLVGSRVAFAQDLPLRDILIDGQGWVAIPDFARVRAVENRFSPSMPLDGSVFGWEGVRPRVEMALSRDGATLFAVNGIDPWVYAVPCADGMPKKPGTKYAPLRRPRGETKSGAGSIVLDAVGRFYVATAVGIQVFDPTGRLCGVMHPTPDGPLDDLVWTGKDKSMLTGRAGGKTYGRLMNVSGAP